VLYWLLKYIVLGPVLRLVFRPRVEGREHVPDDGPAIIASNHLSFSDSIFMPLMVKRPEGTRSPDGRLYRGKTGVARLALESGATVIPVAMLNADEIQPPGKIIPKIRRVRMRFGAPLDFSRYAGLSGDRFIERAVTDEIMYELMQLSGREYIDVYAQKAKSADAPAATTAQPEPEPERLAA
jgi:1-acyl-sn-glycerol-3-phosphate acyltransferase